MAEAYALHEGSFGRAVVLELRDDLIPHAHAESQLVFWLGGARAETRIGNELVRYDENTALGTNSYEAHDARVLDREQGVAIFLVFYIAQPWLDERRAASGRSFFFRSPAVPIDAGVRHRCWEVLDTILSPHRATTGADIDARITELLSAAIDSAKALPGGARLAPTALILDRRVRSAIALMRQNIGEPLAIEDIAKQVGLSRGHLFALFREQLNTTPQVFWSAVKIEEAVRRMAERNDSLTSLAMDLGFSSSGNFSRFFREHMGVSPSRFRRVAAGGLHPLTAVP